jgi:hypothetical protein
LFLQNLAIDLREVHVILYRVEEEEKARTPQHDWVLGWCHSGHREEKQTAPASAFFFTEPLTPHNTFLLFA